MMRNWKQLAGLGGILVALAGLATWDEWKTKQDEKDKETKGLILNIKSAAVTGIVFHSTGDGEGGEKDPNAKADPAKVVDATLKLVNGQWEITSPIKAKADQQAISDLLKNVTEYKSESEVASSRDQWPAFGLTNPRRSVELETSDGKKVTFLVGINSPVGFSVYSATSNADTVFAGSQYIATSTGKTLFDLRDKKILGLTAADITEMSLKFPGESFSVTKKDASWTLGGTTAADTVAVNNLADDITNLKAAEFIDSPDKSMTSSMTGKSPFAALTLKTAKETVSLTIADFKGSLYASLPGTQTVFKLHDDAKTKIKKSSRDLRDKKVFSFESASVEMVTIDGEKFRKAGSDWYTEGDAGKFNAEGKFSGAPTEQPKAQQHVRGLLVDLEFARAEDILDAESKESKNLPKAPKHRLSLARIGGKPAIGIDIWLTQENPEMLFIRHSESKSLFRVKRSVIASISPAQTVPVGNEATAPSLSN